jgi:hypothetical protein
VEIEPVLGAKRVNDGPLGGPAGWNRVQQVWKDFLRGRDFLVAAVVSLRAAALVRTAVGIRLSTAGRTVVSRIPFERMPANRARERQVRVKC